MASCTCAHTATMSATKTGETGNLALTVVRHNALAVGDHVFVVLADGWGVPAGPLTVTGDLATTAAAVVMLPIVAGFDYDDLLGIVWADDGDDGAKDAVVDDGSGENGG